MWPFKYPYTNFHEINLDWILGTIKSNEKRISSNEKKIQLLGGDDPLNSLHPVGSFFISLDSTSPASIFGGEWEQIKGRFLLATGNPDENTDATFGQMTGGWNATPGSTGGQDYHTLVQAEMPSHSHTQQLYFAAGESQNKFAFQALNSYNPNATQADAGDSRTTGGNGPHNNMPPYLAVYMWRRVK